MSAADTIKQTVTENDVVPVHEGHQDDAAMRLFQPRGGGAELHGAWNSPT